MYKVIIWRVQYKVGKNLKKKNNNKTKLFIIIKIPKPPLYVLNVVGICPQNCENFYYRHNIIKITSHIYFIIG